MTEEKEPKIEANPNPWWAKIVNQLPVNPKYKEFLLEINATPVMEGKDRKLVANTPDGRKEVKLTTICETPALAYILEETPNGPKIKFVLLPGLPTEEITRQGLLVEKKKWGDIEKV
jgi:hypothetical protein